MSDVFLPPATMARIRAAMARAGLAEKDIEESFVRGAGPGGQKVNKTSSCVQLRHLPSGEVIKCRQTRSREANRWLARRELAERLLARRKDEQAARRREEERIRRRKRRRSRRRQMRLLAEKRRHSEKKALRRSVTEHE